MGDPILSKKAARVVWAVIICLALVVGGVIGYALGPGSMPASEDEEDLETIAFWLNWDEMSSQERREACANFEAVGPRETAKIAEEYGLDGDTTVRNYREACG